MVRKERLELSRLTALVPKTSASTNSATLAFDLDLKVSKSIKRVLYLKFAKFDKIKPYFHNIKPKSKHKIVLTLTNYIDKQALQIARYNLTLNFKK
jgi:hypothetical protein